MDGEQTGESGNGCGFGRKAERRRCARRFISMRDIRQDIVDVDLNDIETSFYEIYRNRPHMESLIEEYPDMQTYEALQSQVVFMEAMGG